MDYRTRTVRDFFYQRIYLSNPVVFVTTGFFIACSGRPPMIPSTMNVEISDDFKQGFVEECLSQGADADTTETLFKAAVACRQLDAPGTKQAFESRLKDQGQNIPMLAKARAYSLASGRDLF